MRNGIDIGWYFYFWFPRQFPLLTIGIVFYFLEKNKIEDNINNSFYTFFFVLACEFLISKSINPILDNHIQYGVLLFTFSYTLFNKVETGKIFNWMKILGDNSYGIYLFHGCLLPTIGEIVSKIGFVNTSCNFILCYISTLFLSLLISKIVNIVLEKPFWNFTNKIFGI